ncbi:MAG: ATP-dependent Clp protease ATP-binding subunit, partial [Clostridia bacterium]|nr:ATP-dependent Clp protease ATP-binding subunit [Clostridia bacterium]
FQPITVNEPSIDETMEMLCGIKHYYEEFHGVIVPETVLRRAVVLSERYITDRYLPDKAIDLSMKPLRHFHFLLLLSMNPIAFAISFLTLNKREKHSKMKLQAMMR